MAVREKAALHMEDGFLAVICFDIAVRYRQFAAPPHAADC